MKRILLIGAILLSFVANSQTVIVGKYKYTDSLTFAKYKNSVLGDSVLTTDINGRLKMTVNTSVDTTSLSNRINARVKYTDTAAMLMPYLRKFDTAGKWLGTGWLGSLVKYSDTALMLNPYLRKLDTASLSNRINTKEPIIAAGTTAQYWRGDKSWQTLNTSVVPEGSNKYFTEPRVLNTVLTNYRATQGVVVAGDSLLNAFNKLAANALDVSSTGVYTFGGLSLASSTTFNIGPANGFIVKNTIDTLYPTVKKVFYAGGTGLTDPNLTTSTETYVLLDSNGTLILQPNYPNGEQRRLNIYLGKLGHPDKISFLNAFTQPDIIMSPLSQLRDVWTPINLINSNVYPSPNGANLNFNTSEGTLYGLGIGWSINTLSPSSVTISAQSPTTFRYRTQTGGTGGNITTIDPSNYDNVGTITAVGGGANSSTNQRIFALQNGQIRVQYGQKVYASLPEAIAGIQTETFVTFPNFKDNAILIGILSVKKGITDLSNTGNAQFLLVSKFGESVGSAGGISTTTLQQAYDNSVIPNILTNSTLGGLSIQRGSASDGDNVINLRNGAGSTTWAVTGLGNVTGNSFTKTGGTSSQFLKADGSTDATAYNKVSDTAAMLSPYARTLNTTQSLALKVNISDTASMLSPYAKDLNVVHIAGTETITGSKSFVDLSASNTKFINGVSLQQGNSSSMLGYTGLAGTSTGLRIALPSTIYQDFIFNTSNSHNYTFPNTNGTIALTSDVTGKLNIADTSAMLTNYSRDFNTVHKTGAETISGAKTFLDNILVNNSGPTLSFNNAAGTTNYGYLYSNATYYQFNNSNTGGYIWKNGALANTATLDNSGNFYTLGGATITGNLTTNVASAILKTSAAGVVQAATAGTDYLVPSNITGKVNYTDTATMLSNYRTGLIAVTASDASKQVQLNGTGFVKASGTTISYDNSTYYLASNPNGYTSNTGTVTSIATTGPITGGTITTSGTIGITQATTSASGYLSNTDWNTFNGKQNALTNPVTGTGTSGYLTKWTGTNTVNGSVMFDNGTNIGIGTATYISRKLTIYSATADNHLMIAGEAPAVRLVNTLTGATNSVLFGMATAVNNYVTNSIAGDFAITAATGNNILWGINSIEKMRIYSDGNVGIGTNTSTNAGYKLDVNGTGRLKAAQNVMLYLEANGAVSPSIAFTTTNGTNYIQSDYTTSSLKFITGTTALTLASTGAATFSSSVTAGGNVNLPFQGALWWNDDGSSNTSRRRWAIASNYDTYGSLSFKVGTSAGSEPLSGTTVMNITNGGNVGIGTSSPSQSLHVVNANSSTVAIFKGPTNSYIQLGTSGESYIGNLTSGALTFEAGGSERMRITSGGNTILAYNGTDYGQKLQVNGQARISNSLQVYGYTSNNDYYAEIAKETAYFTNGVANQAQDIYFGNTYLNGWFEVEITGGFSNTDVIGILRKTLIFGANPNNAVYHASESRIAESFGAIASKVYIGDFEWDASVSQYKITIYSLTSLGNNFTVRVKQHSIGAANGVTSLTFSSLYTRTSPFSGTNIPYYNSDLKINTLGTGLVYSNGGILTSTNPSDSTLKNTIQPLSYGLAEIMQLQPKTFYYNNDTKKSNLKYGFVAQEVQKIMPDMVRKINADSEKLGLESDGIYVTLVNAIKELKAEIEQLKIQINK